MRLGARLNNTGWSTRMLMFINYQKVSCYSISSSRLPGLNETNEFSLVTIPLRTIANAYFLQSFSLMNSKETNVRYVPFSIQHNSFSLHLARSRARSLSLSQVFFCRFYFSTICILWVTVALHCLEV